MRHVYGQWDERFDCAKGLYWIEPLLDATEYTISSIDASGGKDGFRGGDAFRPSINAYMFANARALSRSWRAAGDRASGAANSPRAPRRSGPRVQRDLWNAGARALHRPLQGHNEHVRYWEPIRGRELVGYVPWTFDLPDDDARYAAAWTHLLSRAEFGGPGGAAHGRAELPILHAAVSL